MKKFVSLLFAAILFAGTGCAQQKKETSEQTAGENKTSVAYNVKKVATMSNETLLASITGDYKGKVTLIDFWATWCGPCRKAMTEIDKIKPELKKKGVAFVYITGETSPEGTWSEMIKNIEGDHYRLTNEQWKYICESLGIVGIPCYMLLDKEGNISYSNLTVGGYPGNELIQQEIEKAEKAK